MKFPRGLIFALVGVSLALSWYFARSGADAPRPRAQCLSHTDCQSSERCVVVPKGDGFATFGQCGELCTEDAACPNGWDCRPWVEEQGHLGPEKGKAPELARVQVCMHRAVQ